VVISRPQSRDGFGSSACSWTLHGPGPLHYLAPIPRELGWGKQPASSATDCHHSAATSYPAYLHTAFSPTPTQFLAPLPIDHLEAFCRPIIETGLSPIMGIFSARSSSGKHPDQVKSDTSVADHEVDLSANGGTQDQDEADMAKAGHATANEGEQMDVLIQKIDTKTFTNGALRGDLD
jgi:hypothetical protein